MLKSNRPVAIPSHDPGMALAGRKLPLSVVVPVLNEERNIRDALESVTWADEIWIVDSRSADRTTEVAREYTDRVVQFDYRGDWPKKKNWALASLPFRNEWVLVLDADERVPVELREEMSAAIKDPSFDGYYIDREFHFLGKQLGCFSPDWNLRLFKHRFGRYEILIVDGAPSTGDNEVHEHVRLEGKAGYLRHPLLHQDERPLRDWVDRHNRYSDWEVALYRQFRREPLVLNPIKLVNLEPVWRRRALKRIWVRLPFRPFLRFFYWYFVRRGFIDGYRGFLYSVFMGFHEFIIGMKLYEGEEAHAEHQRSLSTGEHEPVLAEARNLRKGPAADFQDRASQLTFYRERVDHEEEIERPRRYPRAVQFLLNFKIDQALALAGMPLAGLSALVICGGSGMDAEGLERRGLRVTLTDLSVDALARAVERARRHSLHYVTAAADATCLPFQDSSFDIVFVHDGLHHLPEPGAAIAEMCRVARSAIVVSEPQRGPMTRLALLLHISSNWEDAGNYVFRLRGPEIARAAAERGFQKSVWRAHLVYYQPWTFPVFRLLSWGPLFQLFKAGFFITNSLIGRWGNSLKFLAWRND